jgi:excisionase family DNA binding protein
MAKRQSQTGADSPALALVSPPGAGDEEELNRAGRRQDEAWFANRLALNPREAARALGLGHDAVYALLNAEKLKSVRVGSRRLIPVAELRRFLEQGSE